MTNRETMNSHVKLIFVNWMCALSELGGLVVFKYFTYSKQRNNSFRLTT